MTPTVESMIPGPRTVRISLSFVSKPPEEEDDRQGDHPDELRLVRVVVLDPEARTAEEHPCDEEEEQGRHPKARATLPAMIPASIRRILRGDTVRRLLEHDP